MSDVFFLWFRLIGIALVALIGLTVFIIFAFPGG